MRDTQRGRSRHRRRPRPSTETALVPTTFVRLLQDHARQRPGAPALREKEYGIWQTTSWSALLTLVQRLSQGLQRRRRL